MSLPAQNPKQQLVAAGGQTVFAFTFRCDDSLTIQVWSNDLQLGGVAVALNADQSAAPGGTVTIAAAIAGDIVTIERVTPQTQTLALTAYNAFTAAAITTALDRMVELLQEFWAFTARMFYVKRSVQSKITTFQLPTPVAGQVLGWVSGDGGLTFRLDNLGNVVVGVTLAGTLVKNEVTADLVNGTNGNDGNALFTLAHTPASDVLLDVLVDGVRQPNARWTRVVRAVTFQNGYKPIVGSDVRFDYFY